MEYKVEHVYIKPEIDRDVEIQPLQTQTTFVPVKIENGNTNPDSIDSSEQNQTDRKIQFEGKVYENGKINRLQCPECDRTFKNRANLKAHLKFVHATEDDVVECTLCFRTFKSLQHLRSHKNSVHVDSPADLPCDHCDKIFPNKKKLNNHVFYCHPDPEKDVQCGVCSKIFKTKYRLKIHMKQVHPEGQEVDCPHCAKRFKNPMLLQRHVKWTHPSDGMVYRCLECGRVLPSIDGYRRHMSAVHSSVNVSCDTCGKLFKTAASLNRHNATIHSPTKPPRKTYKTGDIPCSDCGKMFTTTTSLSWHIQKFHVNSLERVCKMCDREFADANNLKRHIDTVHSVQAATCEICCKMFKSQINLQRHMKITHAPPEAAKSCDICNKTFKCSIHLKVHNNVVHQSGNYECTMCKKVFTSKKYLMKHEKTHNSKEYPCSYCMKLFKTVNDVNKHIRRVHTKNNEERTCVECGQCFEDDVGLQAHINNCGNIPEMALQIKMEVDDSAECETDCVGVVDYENTKRPSN